MRASSDTARKAASATLALVLVAALALAVTAPARTGPEPCTPDVSSIPSGLGVNVQTEGLPQQEIAAQLEQVKAAGFAWVRQSLRWSDVESTKGDYDWAFWDAFTREAHRLDLRIIAVLEDAPAWAKAAKDVALPGAPPRDLAAFSAFAENVARRYQEAIAAYQIWDQPNLGANWGSDGVNPAAYTALLSAGFQGIRRGDGAAVVLGGGLAPTTERSPQNLNDVDFLQGMYAAGSGPFFDALAIKPYGFWSGADAPASPEETNFARAALHRQVMCEHGDGDKGIWAVEFGWNALPADWKGFPSPWGTDAAETQESRSLDAVRHARRQWPWMGPMVWATYQPQAATDDPIWGFALVTQSGETRPFARDLGALSALAYVGPGEYRAAPSEATWTGNWRFSPLGADIGGTGDAVEIAFSGTRIDLHLHPGDYWANLYLTVDGRPATALPKDADGRAYVTLYDPRKQPRAVTVARGLADGDHSLRLEAEGGWGQWALAGWAVYRETGGALPRAWLVLGVLVLAALLVTTKWWARLVCGFVRRSLRLPGWALLLANAAGIALLLCGLPWLPLAGMGVVGLCVLVRLDLSLGIVAASLPFYQVYGPFFGRQVSVTLALLAAAVLAAALRWFATWVEEGALGWRIFGGRHVSRSLRARVVGWWRSLDSMDFGVAALVLVAALSLTASERLDVSLREWVQVVAAAGAFYALVRSQRGERAVWLSVDGLTIGATVIAALALVQLALGRNLITAEGVFRVRGLYGSPNNLALFLGRTVPIALCLAAFGRRRRRAYGVAAAVQFAALFLTFSRGALLVGLPAALLFIGVVRGGKALWAALAGIAVVVVGLIPLAGTERIASLFRAGEGTTFLRLNLWRSAWAMVRDHPLRGVGLDNFLYAYRTRYILPAAWEERNLSHPHNIVLDWWTRLGILGPVVLAWLLAAFFHAAARLYRRLANPTLRALTLGLMASMVHFLAHGLVDNAFFLTDLALAFALTLGIIGTMRRGIPGN